jgi:hypothetical protein
MELPSVPPDESVPARSSVVEAEKTIARSVAQPVRLANVPPSRSDETIVGDEPPSRSLHETARAERTTISGPSFLGLTDDSESDQSAYLLEEERSGRRGGWFLFATIIIIVFVVIGWLEWNTIKTGRLNIPFIRSAASDPQPKSSASEQSASAQPANANSNANANDSDTNDKFTTTEPGDASKPSASDKAPEATPASPAKPAPEPPQPSDQSVASAEDEKQSDLASTPSAKAKPGPARTAAAAEPAPDPHNNKMLLLGEKYLYGQGVAKNCNQAMVYFRAAADENNAPAMSHLGAMYASGNCVAMDRATAYQWFARAENADPGNQWLARNLNMLWRDMTPKERSAINR